MITAPELVNLFYLRRLIVPLETEAQSLAAVKDHVLKARQFLNSITDPRTWENTASEITALDAARAASETAAAIRQTAVAAWISTHPQEVAGKTWEQCARAAGV